MVTMALAAGMAARPVAPVGAAIMIIGTANLIITGMAMAGGITTIIGIGMWGGGLLMGM
ncbi:hypothetical protein Aam_039_054 [Acidocella aminolytica 101 = DSM 11237]|jgi:hypothetical protein|uniref:Uncharacterized protein n=1 Tax=Acidocella aminolytica 101 = DSM 11237 TaxID=1120923 RepID=A0A0D6PET7_9PROT|nr:hypothetical protein Aam_039_054 [Acidocella aminolytica 101 = DSM 11237]GBQ33425.1 hypothetical protein AA11237_0445 [Acidocella aminolytica 101 = DSM 11237]